MKRINRSIRLAGLLGAATMALSSNGFAQAGQAENRPAAVRPTLALSPDVRAELSKATDRGIAYLKSTQNPDGGFGDGDFSPSFTGLAIHAMLKTGRVAIDDPAIQKGLSYLESFVQQDGGIRAKSGAQANYSTAAAVLAFSSANRKGKYDALLKKAAEYLKAQQWDEGEKTDEKDVRYGGAGYGGPKQTRPDLSNTAFLLEALKASGVPEDDPAYKRALVFVTRCQNYSGEGGSDQAIAKMVDDGGFFYTPAENYNPGGGNEKQGLRSYGSMTYAGLKSYLTAGVKRDDPRVKAALGWIRKHYTLSENPGLGEEGQFYYFHTFAKTFAALGEDVVVDAEGKEHNWRLDYVKEILARQQKDGGWTNKNKRWLENDGRLSTTYVLLGVGHVLAPSVADAKPAEANAK
jgi:squalene-hopene/tetraprenyl-beta-curcumene cyclase